MRRHLLLTLASLLATLTVFSQSSGYPELDRMVQAWRTAQQTTFGYPASQESELAGFYQWYAASGMDVINLNNAGDPMTDDPSTLSSQLFERQVIKFFAPLYDFNQDNVWGIVTHSGTDSNTVFFRRPSPEIIRKYTLAQGYDERFGGELAHVVVMQHVSQEKIDMFIADLDNSRTAEGTGRRHKR